MGTLCQPEHELQQLQGRSNLFCYWRILMGIYYVRKLSDAELYPASLSPSTSLLFALGLLQGSPGPCCAQPCGNAAVQSLFQQGIRRKWPGTSCWWGVRKASIREISAECSWHTEGSQQPRIKKAENQGHWGCFFPKKEKKKPRRKGAPFLYLGNVTN